MGFSIWQPDWKARERGSREVRTHYCGLCIASVLMIWMLVSTPDMELLESLWVREPGLKLFSMQLHQTELTGKTASPSHPSKSVLLTEQTQCGGRVQDLSLFMYRLGFLAVVNLVLLERDGSYVTSQLCTGEMLVTFSSPCGRLLSVRKPSQELEGDVVCTVFPNPTPPDSPALTLQSCFAGVHITSTLSSLLWRCYPHRILNSQGDAIQVKMEAESCALIVMDDTAPSPVGTLKCSSCFQLQTEPWWSLVVCVFLHKQNFPFPHTQERQMTACPCPIAKSWLIISFSIFQ